MQSYKLTQKADCDLEYIFNYGIDHFGLDLAITFYQGLSGTFDKITHNPEYYPTVDEILPRYRRAIFKSYSIFFIQKQSHIEITRVLRKELIDASFFE